MRVLVVDDNELWRASLVRALGERGITVVVEAGSTEELEARLRGIDAPDLDVAVLDLRLPPTWSDEGIHVARRLRAAAPGIGIIILSGYEQDVQLYYATRALEDLEDDGGIGYLTKDRATRASLTEAIGRVAAGRLVVDPIFSREAADEYRDRHARDENFSPREVEVLDLLVQGATNKEISQNLHLSEPAIERHLTRIFQKVLPVSSEQADAPRRDNRRVLTVLEWLRRCGRLT